MESSLKCIIKFEVHSNVSNTYMQKPVGPAMRHLLATGTDLELLMAPSMFFLYKTIFSLL